jgi:hypothetical protein
MPNATDFSRRKREGAMKRSTPREYAPVAR